MEVHTGRESGHADVPDHLLLLHPHAGPDPLRERLHVRIARLVPAHVPDLDQIAVAAITAREDHRAIRRRVDRRARGRAEIRAVVPPVDAEHRMVAVRVEVGRDPEIDRVAAEARGQRLAFQVVVALEIAALRVPDRRQRLPAVHQLGREDPLRPGRAVRTALPLVHEPVRVAWLDFVVEIDLELVDVREPEDQHAAVGDRDLVVVTVHDRLVQRARAFSDRAGHEHGIDLDRGLDDPTVPAPGAARQPHGRVRVDPDLDRARHVVLYQPAHCHFDAFRQAARVQILAQAEQHVGQVGAVQGGTRQHIRQRLAAPEHVRFGPFHGRCVARRQRGRIGHGIQ